MNKDTQQFILLIATACVFTLIGYTGGHDIGLNDGRNEGYYLGYEQCEMDAKIEDWKSWAEWYDHDWVAYKNNNTLTYYYDVNVGVSE